MPEIIVIPKNPLIDELLQITVSGISSYKNVTIKANTVEGSSSFSSYACYTTDKDGCVYVWKQPAIAGTYTGVKPMGLFWSMKQDPGKVQGRRYTKRIVNTPQDVTLSVIEGHLSWDNIHSDKVEPLKVLKIQRWFKKENVKRVEIKHERLQGTLFIPPGPGPFPAILDLFGTVGGTIEFRAAMLANKGFITCALQYMRFARLGDINFSYLKEAVEWLSNYPCTTKSGVGIYGVSKGGELALLLSTVCPQVKAIVNINGPPYCSVAPVPPFEQFVELDSDSYYTVDTGGSIVLHSRDSICENLTTDKLTPTWTTDVKILYIVGEDDRSLNPRVAQMLFDAYPENKRQNLTIIKYPGAGHLIEPPYLPVCSMNTKTISNVNKGQKQELALTFVWGGKTEDHAMAQKDSWEKIVTFFRSVLSDTKLTISSQL